ncbi:F0F1 ATP synthase subunit B [Marinimicrobium alkaliphilum]|uniref:F0F1 ATP synthase subunit B n=1 Tax=Marinimicrobium alkaliphilum TaxID=2202654 RepID=UPI000DB9A800|nr:F0F1 ATP synthase subunit B [Marinimicrobium alkaliphilum]
MNFNLTFIGQMIAFAVFVWFCIKFVWPPLMNAIEERQKTITEGLAAADRAGRDLELAQEKATKTLREARKEAAGIIESANKRGAQIIDEAKESARAEAERIKVAAHAEIDQDVERAREKLRSQVAVLALAGAEKVLESSVDANTHKAMIDKLAANL